MGSSPGFASIPVDNGRPIQTRFPYGSGLEDLSPPTTITRRIIIQ